MDNGADSGSYHRLTQPMDINSPVKTTHCTIPWSIIELMILPILAMVIAPDSVNTTQQPGSSTPPKHFVGFAQAAAPEGRLCIAVSRPSKDPICLGREARALRVHLAPHREFTCTHRALPTLEVNGEHANSLYTTNDRRQRSCTPEMPRRVLQAAKNYFGTVVRER